MNLIKTSSFELAIYAKGDRDSAKLAIVIPGRLDTKDYAHNTSLVDYLADRGYYALSFDPPGTWESAGDISLYSTTNCIVAVNELIEHFGNKPTLLAGHSRGGSIAMLAAPKNPHVTHLISIFSNYGAPVAPSPERIVDNKIVELRDLPPGTFRTSEKRKFLLPLDYFKDGNQYNALPGLKEYKKPKLFFYGEFDKENDPKNVKKAFEIAAEPKMIQSVASEHDYRLHSDIIEEANNTIGKFLSQ